MLRKFCEVTSCNGIIDLYEARKSRCSLTFWAFVLVLMLCFNGYFTYRVVLSYIMCPTVTNVATVSSVSLDLPSILLCYLGGYNASAMDEIFTEHLSMDFLKASYFYDTATTSKTEYASFLNHNNVTTLDIMDMISFKCDDIMVFFQTGLFNNIHCNKSVMLINDYGKCYYFDPDTKQLWPGHTGGLFLQLREPNNSYFATYPKVSTQIGLMNAFYVSLEKKVGSQVTDRNILVPLNSRVEISLNTKHYIRLQKCSNENGSFTSNHCFYQRYINKVNEKVGCVPLHYFVNPLNQSKIKACDPFVWRELLVSESFLTQYNVLDEISQFCVPTCEEWIFDFTISNVQVDANLLEFPSSKISIFYSTMQYTKVEEVQAFTIDMAVANVGGQFGLWLGASFVTIIQAMYYFIACLAKKEKEISSDGKRNKN